LASYFQTLYQPIFLLFQVAINQLIETGAITFDTPVDSIVPELADPVVLDDPNALEYTYKPAQKKMLIKHLLNHSSGLHYCPEHRKASPADLSPAYTAVAYGGDYSWKKFFEIIRVCLWMMLFVCVAFVEITVFIFCLGIEWPSLGATCIRARYQL
jgi:hypothetical protein